MFSTMKMPEDMLPAYNLSKNVATVALEAAHARSNGGSARRGLWGVTGVAADPRVPEGPTACCHLILAARTVESAPSPIGFGRVGTAISGFAVGLSRASIKKQKGPDTGRGRSWSRLAHAGACWTPGGKCVSKSARVYWIS